MNRSTFIKVFIFFIAHLSSVSLASPLVVFVTVDWEGFELDEVNTRALLSLRGMFPDVPFVHFLNPAYFLKPGLDEDEL